MTWLSCLNCSACKKSLAHVYTLIHNGVIICVRPLCFADSFPCELTHSEWNDFAEDGYEQGKYASID